MPKTTLPLPAAYCRLPTVSHPHPSEALPTAATNSSTVTVSLWSMSNDAHASMLFSPRAMVTPVTSSSTVMVLLPLRLRRAPGSEVETSVNDRPSAA
ncbi:MAG: hypothetical protein HY699_25105 [Deltaproteobacteria bacterium]|nr:hypothetical protein [Deltaproteobacteria bacterium]